MGVKWKRELDFLLSLLFIGLMCFLAPELLNSRVANFSSVLTVLTLIYILIIMKKIVPWNGLSEKLYDAGIYSLFIVIASYFFDKVLIALGLSRLYSVYLGGFGYLLASVLMLLAPLVYLVKKLSE